MILGAETLARIALSQYWDTGEPPGYVLDLCETFRAANPDFDHHLYSKADAEELIAAHFGPRELAAFRACAVPSMQSDYFRYCAVLALGGVYADVDYRCLGSLRPLLERSAGGELFLGPTQWSMNGREANRIWSGFFAFRTPGHRFLELALEIATANIESRLAQRAWPGGEKVVEGIWLTVGPGVPTLMRFLYEWGSFEAFEEGLAGTVMEPFAAAYRKAIGNYGRIVEAFEGVRVSPSREMFRWVADPDAALPYQRSEVHWKNAKGSIFSSLAGDAVEETARG